MKESLEDTAARQLRKGLAESPAAEETVFEDAVCTRLNLGGRTREVMWNLFL